MPSEATLLIIRHGQTDSNAGGILQGHLPVPLNALGRRQAAALAARLTGASPKIARVVASHLSRAVQTAEPIAAALGLRPELDPDWAERAFGDLEGKPIGERRAWALVSGDENPPGAETVRDFEARVRRALERAAESTAGAPAAIVTHGGPVRVILRMLSDGRLPVEGDRPPPPPMIANCSILQLHRNGEGEWRVACVNDVTHLEGVVEVTDTDAG